MGTSETQNGKQSRKSLRKRERISFYQDASHRYMVLDCGNKDTGNYRYRMLAANSIPGLLSCDVRYIEANCCIYYDIAGKKSLADHCEKKTEQEEVRETISGNVVYSVICELLKTEKKLSEFLLDFSGLILDVNYIFEDTKTGRWLFAYSPCDEQHDKQENSLAKLAEYLAFRVDMADTKAVSLAYRFSSLSSDPNYILDDTILEDENGNEELNTLLGNTEEQTANGHEWDQTELSNRVQPEPEQNDISEFENESDMDEKDSAGDHSDPENEAGNIRPGDQIFLAIVLWLLAVFIIWFGNVMRLRDREQIVDLATAGTMAVCGMYFIVKYIVGKIRRKRNL